MTNRAFLLVPVLALSACWELPRVKCLDDSRCIDAELNRGRCLNTSVGPYCAYPDTSCPTQWRWWDGADTTLRNECVAPSIPLDASVDSAPADMSTVDASGNG